MGDLAKPQRPPLDLSRFPSHTHINLLPEARGTGVGLALFYRMFDMLKGAGSIGTHEEASADNERIIAVSTQKLGYELVGEPYLAPGGRMPDGRRMWLRLLTRDLTHWVPGAWMHTTDARAHA